ncbi:hypothetical protein PGT21_031798 [Puccinia graminis f. sp. tritici]|uniref:CCR4-NOT transcription complex subunit 1-like NOT1 connector domain-containing protein n=1 Tax=Puccinia graminis f. sp. tritici TaxID=56615 RepID=A0A5B0Q7T7_PUCGR|nr:hypothetical protein PGT21_031798 [Puccinia graminis f. sp. tritici]
MIPDDTKSRSRILLTIRHQRKYNVPMTLVLITHQIVSLGDFDAQSAKLILRDYKPSLMNYVAEFIEACVKGSESSSTLLRFSPRPLRRVTSIMQNIQDKLPALGSAKDLGPVTIKSIND